MNTILKNLIESAERLSHAECIQLIEMVSHLLRRDMDEETIAARTVGTPSELTHLNTTAFWQGQTLAELAREQGVTPIDRLEELTVDFWPEDESPDDLIKVVYVQRKYDREQEAY